MIEGVLVFGFIEGRFFRKNEMEAMSIKKHVGGREGCKKRREREMKEEGGRGGGRGGEDRQRIVYRIQVAGKVLRYTL